MESEKYLQDLAEIKDLMNKSSRFLSLSGLSGILAGIYAIVGAAIAYVYLIPDRSYEPLMLHSWNFRMLLVLLVVIAALSIGTALALTFHRAKKNNEAIWNATARRMLLAFLTPLVTGGLYILIKLSSQHYGLTAALMLIFYGLSLVNASKYTLSRIQYLGYTQIILGLICAAIPGYGFWFWVMGFGVLHILYGAMMYIDEKRA